MAVSRSWFRSIAFVFNWRSLDEKEMQAQIGRLCVLYEDLQVEWAGAEAKSLGELDRTSVNTRRFYFVRRSLATLTEVSSCVGQLQRNRAFAVAKRLWGPETTRMWTASVKFFEDGHHFLNDWRNEVGGHFHARAARYAIENLHADTVASIEVYRRGKGEVVRMPFAYELVAIALTKNKDEAEPEKAFIEGAFAFLVEATTAGIQATQVIVKEMVLPKFR